MTKKEALDALNDFAEQIRQQLKGGRTSTQIFGMMLKAQHAANLIEKGENAADDDYDIIALEADKRGRNETADELAEKIIAKRKQFAKASAWIEGLLSRGEYIVNKTPEKKLKATVAKLLSVAQEESNQLQEVKINA